MFNNLLPDESTMASDASTGATDSVNQVGELDSMSEVTTKDSSSSASAGARVFAIQGEANPFTTSVESKRLQKPGTGATDSLNQVGELDSMSEVTTKDSSPSASAWARVVAIQEATKAREREANPFTTSVEERARLRAIQEATKAREREAYRSAVQRYSILQHNAINNN